MKALLGLRAVGIPAAFGVMIVLTLCTAGRAEETGPTTAEVSFAIDNMVLLGAAVLVLMMQAGFAMLEVGLNAAKNTVNILSKNVMDLCVGALLFFIVGYGLMYPGDAGAG